MIVFLVDIYFIFLIFFNCIWNREIYDHLGMMLKDGASAF